MTRMNTRTLHMARAAGSTVWLLALACQIEPSPSADIEVVTSVQALAPHPALMEPQRIVCPEVNRQARELGAMLPRQLDADTLALAVTAKGCDLTLEYQLTTLEAKDVTESGLRAVRLRVGEQLCTDRGALGVMQQGGRFTNIYYDKAKAPIGLFSVSAEDCGI